MNIFALRKEKQSIGIDYQLAESFRQIMTFGAWKHLEKIMEKIKIDAMNTIDQTPLQNLDSNTICYAKGMREAITKIEREINLCLNGGTNALEK